MDDDEKFLRRPGIINVTIQSITPSPDEDCVPLNVPDKME
jgi:hypothetical protein